jgi:putative solute:sodium symporter small subunit
MMPAVDVAIRIRKLERPDMSEQFSKKNYWKANLKLVALCLSIWFVVSYLFGIILLDQLNAFSLGGYRLGFWFAQQGSIYVFVILIFFYAWRMNKLDKEFDVHED